MDFHELNKNMKKEFCEKVNSVVDYIASNKITLLDFYNLMHDAVIYKMILDELTKVIPQHTSEEILYIVSKLNNVSHSILDSFEEGGWLTDAIESYVDEIIFEYLAELEELKGEI